MKTEYTVEKWGNDLYLARIVDGKTKDVHCPFKYEEADCGAWCALFEYKEYEYEGNIVGEVQLWCGSGRTIKVEGAGAVQ